VPSGGCRRPSIVGSPIARYSAFYGRGSGQPCLSAGLLPTRTFEVEARGIYLFYLNTGSELARIEVPQWVALRGDLVDLVHAVIIEQCQLNNGYPYVLTRADEQAIVLGEERLALETMIGRAMARHGLPPPELSRKAQQKQIARWRRNG